MLALAALVAGLLPSSGTAQILTGSPEYGVKTFLEGRPETTDRDIALATEAGFQWVKITPPWRSFEASCKGCIDWSDLDRVVAAANAAGVKILARFDFAPEWARPGLPETAPPNDHYDYADFVSEVARRYANGSPKGTIHAIQVWNEPNLDYMSLLRQTYTLVKQMDPTKIVVSAGLSPTGTNDGTAMPDDVYLTWLYENGLREYSDAVGMHAPGYGSHPEAELNSNPGFPHPSFYFRRVEQLRNIMVLNGDAAKQAWILEFGWTTDPIHPDRTFYAVTAEQQADYLVRGFRYAYDNWRPWIGPMFVWNIPDPQWTPDFEQYWWGITEPDGNKRPAHDAIRDARRSGYLP
jgi:polysaccharide biosynthesis protein PslG